MRKLLGIFIFLFTITTYGQKEANFWYFGHKAGLDFSTTPPTAITGELDTFEGASTISDKQGNLLFYSDGTNVWSKNNQLMRYSNGSPANDLLGNPSSTQSALVIPKPSSSTIYYLFTVGTNRNRGLNYYTIDVSKNNGLGEIIDGPVDLSGTASNTWSEKVTAVEGKDCDTFWVISTDINNFYSYKVDKNGVIKTPVTSSFGQTINTTRFIQF